MRRKRRTKYTWLPSDGTTLNGADDTVFNLVPFTLNGLISQANPAGTTLPTVVFTNVLADFPETDIDTAAVSMADEIGSEYFLKRIVGKCFVELIAEANGDHVAGLVPRGDCPTVLVTVGFFVAPTDPENVGAPLGSAQDLFQRYNPVSVGAIRQPWIWRRSWMLSPIGLIQPVADSTTTNGSVFLPATGGGIGTLGQGSFPPTNTYYGSVSDGPHIDAKTARRIAKHERLWVALSMQIEPEQESLHAEFGTVTAQATFDLRCLGALRKARNRSNFT